MDDQNKHNTLSPKLIAGLAVILFLGGSVTAWLANKSLQSNQQSQNNPIPIEIKPPVNQQENPPLSQQQEIQVYWIDDNLELIPKTISIAKSENKEESLKSIFEVLLAGKKDTTIPDNTKLLSLKVEDNQIKINLSQEFTSGGGSASMVGRLGQIIYTLTAFNPDAQIWIDVEGKPLEELGGEGLIVEQPMTKQIFDDNFSF